ncbi:hypothetical protein HWB19_gp084 [Cronobacter phage vB_CsaP_009]|uniref:Uncharacterized protein n=1 Tax=Cronobacter phage vB_CsaP_009 TaxID=2699738 RepID=A0A679FL99_9CAUD|nr:hypothetical protein HWB19_gp084 [Cronobacter phage vB_CsaP_009]BBU72730.1 hypothetical protein [Cronobacter phage vB_CsaP_009]
MKWGLQTLQNGKLVSSINTTYIIDYLYVDKKFSKTYSDIGDDVTIYPFINNSRYGSLISVNGSVVTFGYDQWSSPYNAIIMGISKNV